MGMQRLTQRVRPVSAMIASVALLSATAVGAQIVHQNKRVGVLLFVPDNLPCLFLQVEGVGRAHPTLGPDSPWIVLPRNDPRYTDMPSLLITAKTTGMRLDFMVDGPVHAECGHVTLRGIVAPY